MEQSPCVILGSSSRTRHQLLSRLRIPFTTMSPDIDESSQKNEDAAHLAKRLAHAKADAILARIDTDIPLITSDQVMLLNEQILGKPRDENDAVNIIHRCSGQCAAFFTHVVVTDPSTRQQLSHLEKTVVQYRSYSRRTAEQYVKIEQPLRAAGAIHCEGLGISLLERINSNDPTALLGLPLIKLSAMLREMGVDIL